MENKEQQGNAKAGKTGFPKELRGYLALHESGKGKEMEAGLRSWYKENFQKGNRWNKSLIRKGTIGCPVTGLAQLEVGFRLLFDHGKKYNRAFLAYLEQAIAERKAEEGSTEARIEISQEGFNELLHMLGELKASGAVKSSYREMAAAIHRSFAPGTTLRPSTISDRLKNKKGYP